MQIALINLFYPPAGAPTGVLLADLVQALHADGHACHVLTSASGHVGADASGTHEADGVVVSRIGSIDEHARGIAGKLLSYLQFLFQAHRILHAMRPVPDVVVCQTTPPFCGLLARRLLRRKQVPYVLWCMDLYPEALESHGWRRLARCLRGLADRERESATTVVTLGPDMTRRVRLATPEAEVREIPVWSRVHGSEAARRRALELRRSRGWSDDNVVLLYSGNMGRAHSADGFRRLAQAAKASGSRLRFAFCGACPAAASWRRTWGEGIEWLPPVAEGELAAHLLAADVHLVSQRSGWEGVVVPSKYQTACALGRPVVFDGPVRSAIHEWIAEGQTGWFLPECTLEGLVAELGQPSVVSTKGACAHQQSQRLFPADALRGQLVEVITHAKVA